MRNFTVEMSELIAKRTDRPPYEPAVVAQEIVDHLLANDPELLRGYLEIHASAILREAITRRAGSMRMMARKSASGARMKEIVDSVASGTVGSLADIRDRWLNCSFELGDRQQHLLRTMRKDDLLHVAGDYDQRAAQNATEAAFFRALAEKVADKTVGEVFTEEQIVALRAGLSKFK